jgi:hypothetical protein
MGLKRTVAAVELADGTIHTDIRVINPDRLRYGETAQRHKWPSPTVKNEVGTIPILDYEDTFLAWAALTRLGLYSGKWEAFKDSDCVAVSMETVDVDPTHGDTPADSSLNSHTLPGPVSVSNG